MKYVKINKTTNAAVEKATGKGWDYWIELIDREGGDKMTHKEIARMLWVKKYIERGWWCQSVTVGYEYAKGRRLLGETADAGYEIGVSKTLPVSAEKLWKILMSPEGVSVWLGETNNFKLERGFKYKTADNTRGEIRTINPGLKIRLTYQTRLDASPTTLQIYLMANGEYNSQDTKSNKTALRFHHEKLQDKAEREAMKKHWEDVIEELTRLV